MDATGFSVSVCNSAMLSFLCLQMATRQEDGHTWHMARGPQGVKVTGCGQNLPYHPWDWYIYHYLPTWMVESLW